MRSAETIEISSMTSVSIGLVEVVIRDDAGRQAQQRVDRLSADVQRGDAGGRADRDDLARVPGEVVQDGRLAGSGATRDEDVFAGVLDALVDGELLGGELGIRHPPIVACSRAARGGRRVRSRL
jgi:hypothetical protein